MSTSPQRRRVSPRRAFFAAALTVPLLAGCWPCSNVLTKKTEAGKTYVYNCGKLLAVYNHAGNTFTEFRVDGLNLIGGFCAGPPGTSTNLDGAMKGHSPEYPFGHRDANGNMLPWQGFWSGFNYIDQRWMTWAGVPGNALAQCSYSFSQPRDDLLILTVITQVPFCFDPLFQCEVNYYISPAGIGVTNKITIYKDLEPFGYDDTGGQFLMTQVDCDLDPAFPETQADQPDLYYKLALNDAVVSLVPFPPYNPITPSHIYADGPAAAPGYDPLPDSALVPPTAARAILSPFGRPSRNVNLALRIDLEHSTLPPLEYYCEYNGRRDYLNFLLSPAIGQNRATKSVPAGTVWELRGDLLPWKGSDPAVLASAPWLYE